MTYTYHFQESADGAEPLTPNMACTGPADLPAPGDTVQLPGATRPRRVERREFVYASGLNECRIAVCLELAMLA